MFLKKKKITLHCYTFRSDVYHGAPIVHANRMLPDWWSNLPMPHIDLQTLEGRPNMRGCSGFTSMFGKGVMIPLWSDLLIDMTPEGDTGYRWSFADNETHAVAHETYQRGEYLPEEKYSHMKIDSPWAFHCDEDIDWVWQQPAWNFDNPEEVLVPPAIVNYNQFSDTNLNIMAVKGPERKQLMLEAGQPMVHLIPLDGRKVEIKTHLVSREEFVNIIKGKNGQSKFIKNWIYNKNNKLKCPFHRSEDA